MKRFRIYVEETVQVVKYKDFVADSLEDAKELAEVENWDNPSWEDGGQHTDCCIRDELCEELSDVPPPTS